RFKATFGTLDCYVYPLTHTLAPTWFVQSSDVVTRQFCLHHTLESLAKAHTMLENVSKYVVQ
ncbi:hypothetical protein K488DRAFT_37624, partial [Vararia minispora EC-137]